MANLTLKIEDDVLRKARIRALEDGTSVNAVVRTYLESYAVPRSQRLRAMRRILALAERSKTGSGEGGRTWKREDLYER